jgi:hypothetical protein
MKILVDYSLDSFQQILGIEGNHKLESTREIRREFRLALEKEGFTSHAPAWHYGALAARGSGMRHYRLTQEHRNARLSSMKV